MFVRTLSSLFPWRFGGKTRGLAESGMPAQRLRARGAGERKGSARLFCLAQRPVGLPRWLPRLGAIDAMACRWAEGS